MKRPDPVQHMMTWGAVSSGLVLVGYLALTGVFTQGDFDPFVVAVIFGGIFTGFTLGGMAGVIIGTVFQHEQVAINSEKINNRRNIVLLVVFVMVLIVSRLLVVLSTGFVSHPLALSLIGAIIATLASQHYLYRMEDWLKHHKPKRKVKNDDVPSRLVDENDDFVESISEREYEQQTRHS